MITLVLLTIGFISWTVLVAWFASRQGCQRGFTKARLDAIAAFDRGYIQGQRIERAMQDAEPIVGSSFIIFPPFRANGGRH